MKLITIDLFVKATFNYFFLVSVSEVSPETSLNEYLRKKMFLTGTKNMCYEGGCGTCIVSVATKHPVTNQDIKFAVNSVSNVSYLQMSLKILQILFFEYNSFFISRPISMNLYSAIS